MRRAYVLGLAACWWLQAATAWGLGPREIELLTRAERLLARGQTTRALVLVRRAHARAPNDAMLTLKLVSLLLPDRNAPVSRLHATNAQNVSEALSLLDSLTQLEVSMGGPEQRAHAQLRAWALALQDNFSAAIYALRERGSMGDVEMAGGLSRVAALATSRGDLHSAEEAVRAARRFLPEDPELMSDLAALWLAQGRTEESLPLWQARFQREPLNLDARRDLAGAFLAAGHAREAHALLEEVHEACDAAANCAIEAARAALEMGEPKTAIARLAADFAGDSTEALFLLGDAHTRLGALARARRAYEQILRQKPGHPRALENLRALLPRVQETSPN